MNNKTPDTRIAVEIEVAIGSTGNLFDLTDAIRPDLDSGDYIHSVTVIDRIPGVEVELASLAPHGNSSPKQYAQQKLILRGAKGKQLIIDYNTNTGRYEIALNDFGVTEISKLQLMVGRYNPNRRPVR